MGTRSITRVIHNGTPILTFYRQYDGYPAGHGKELADFISGIEFVNGYSANHQNGGYANGAGCFAAQLLMRMKDRHSTPGGIGGIYLHPHDCKNEEFTYTVNISTEG